MKQKSFIAVLLTISMILSACGGAKNTSNEATEGVKEEKVTTSEEIYAENGAGTIGADAEKIEALEPVKEEDVDPAELHCIQVNLTKNTYDINKEDSWMTKAHYEHVTPLLSEAEKKRFPILGEFFEAHASAMEMEKRETLNTLVEMYDSNDFMKENDDFHTLVEENAVVQRADELVVSIAYDSYSYYGGAHPDYGYSADTFDTVSGERLRLEDITKDMDALLEAAQKILNENYPEIAEYTTPLSEYYHETILGDYGKENNMEITYSLGYEGVTLYFSPYEIASYAAGAFFIDLPFSDYADLFVEKYTHAPKSYVIPMPKYHAAVIDLDGSGKCKTVEVETVGDSAANEDWISFNTYKVNVGDRSLILDEAGYESVNNIVCKNGKYYLYMILTSENDYRRLAVVDLQTMTYDEEKCTGGGFGSESYMWLDYETESETFQTTIEFTNPEYFVLSHNVHILGTHGAKAGWAVGDDGYPTAVDSCSYMIGSGGLFSKAEVPCDIVDGDGNVLKKGTAPEGKYYTLHRTDEKTYVDIQEADDSLMTDSGEDEWGYSRIYAEDPIPFDGEKTIYRIYVDTSDYPNRIDGKDEAEWFRGIMYAG